MSVQDSSILSEAEREEWDVLKWFLRGAFQCFLIYQAIAYVSQVSVAYANRPVPAPQPITVKVVLPETKQATLTPKAGVILPLPKELLR